MEKDNVIKFPKKEICNHMNIDVDVVNGKLECSDCGVEVNPTTWIKMHGEWMVDKNKELRIQQEMLDTRSRFLDAREKRMMKEAKKECPMCNNQYSLLPELTGREWVNEMEKARKAK